MRSLRESLRSLERAPLPARAPTGTATPPRRPPCASTRTSQMLNCQYRILNISIAIPQRRADVAEGSPIARSGLGTAPTRACAPDRPERTGPSNEKKPAHGFKLTAPSTKDNLTKTELNHKSRLPHGNVLERGFTVARGAKRCPCSSVVHLRRLDQGDSSFRAEEE